jgi:hypothetical protein
MKYVLLVKNLGPARPQDLQLDAALHPTLTDRQVCVAGVCSPLTGQPVALGQIELLKTTKVVVKARLPKSTSSGQTVTSDFNLTLANPDPSSLGDLTVSRSATVQ